jgi:hypothetical protein
LTFYPDTHNLHPLLVEAPQFFGRKHGKERVRNEIGNADIDDAPVYRLPLPQTPEAEESQGGQ